MDLEPEGRGAKQARSAPQPLHETGAPGVPQPSPRSPRLLRLSLPGAWVALLFTCLAFTPSLLPRSGVFQGFVCGVSAAIGYGLGVLGAWVWRELADRERRAPRPGEWRLLGGVAALALCTSLVLGWRWQAQLRELLEMPPPGSAGYLLVPFVAAAVFGVVLALGWTWRQLSHRLDLRLSRYVGARAARALSWFSVTVLLTLLASGLLWDGLIGFADRTLALSDTTTDAGASMPRSGLRSGGPGSQVSWESLGREGRNFVSGGPTLQQLSAFGGAPAKEPIRVFAGYASAQDAEGRAALAVQELERTGGFRRAHLLVVTTTGSGWVVPESVAAFEYLTQGDSAIVAMQYSHLWSWLSVLVDRERAREAGRELFDAVYERWARLPAGERPRLLVFGESLGSFGMETAFSGERDLANRTDGALFVGPPSFNTLYRDFTRHREPGSPEIAPVFRGGRTVRFSRRPATQLPPDGTPWRGTRVLYLLHPSDPIIWWNSDLLLHRPDWLREPRGADVLGAMVWIPFVTFWQVTADMPLGLAVPPGYGHVYTGEHVDGWAAILQPEGWSAEKAARLRALVQPPP